MTMELLDIWSLKMKAAMKLAEKTPFILVVFLYKKKRVERDYKKQQKRLFKMLLASKSLISRIEKWMYHCSTLEGTPLGNEIEGLYSQIEELENGLKWYEEVGTDSDCAKHARETLIKSRKDKR